MPESILHEEEHSFNKENQECVSGEESAKIPSGGLLSPSR